MATTIHKYTVWYHAEQDVAMPSGAKLLTVQVQADVPQAWAVVDESMPKVNRRIVVRGTGHPISGPVGDYVATFQVGQYVWHVFDLGESS